MKHIFLKQAPIMFAMDVWVHRCYFLMRFDVFYSLSTTKKKGERSKEYQVGVLWQTIVVWKSSDGRCCHFVLYLSGNLHCLIHLTPRHQEITLQETRCLSESYSFISVQGMRFCLAPSYTYYSFRNLMGLLLVMQRKKQNKTVLPFPSLHWLDIFALLC